ncbi:MAG: DUF5615 family PIN-like protein [Bryobacteraceae bacterium]
MRFLIDMNLTPRWVPALSAGGHDAVHWSELGPIGASDPAICDYARGHGFLLIGRQVFQRIRVSAGRQQGYAPTHWVK